jgi:hypothetical protein
LFKLVEGKKEGILVKKAGGIPPVFCFIHRRGIRKGDRVGLKAQSAFEEGARFAPDFTGQPDPVDNRPQ